MNDSVKTVAAPAAAGARDDQFDNLKSHPLADQFEMIKDGEDGGAAFAAMKASIAKSGIRNPIKIYEGRILDGRNRYQAGKAVGYKFTARDFETFRGSEEQAKAYVDDANIHRRHHSKGQKEKLIRARIEEHPGLSNRKIAEMCGVSHTSVNNVRNETAKEDKKLKSFEKTWDGFDDQQRERFVEKYWAEIRELLGLETLSRGKQITATPA
jgi:hypothetical protein